MFHKLILYVDDFRRFMALHISQQIFASDPDIQVDEIVGHSYLFLKEQLQLSIMPPHGGILHGTMIGMACPTFFTFVVTLISLCPFGLSRNNSYVEFCRREVNMVAHNLAKTAISN